LKMISDKSKLLVQGFIHETEHLLFQTDADIIVPDLVINLCISSKLYWF